VSNEKAILIVEDETDVADLIRYNLEREGYSCRCARDGAAALEEIQRRHPDLIVLDRMLPHRSGDEVAMELRREADTRSIPIIMLTAKSDEADELVGFALGVDDYVAKPFSMKTLVARIGAVLRRSESVTDDAFLSAGPFRLDISRHELRVNDSVVPLTATEFRLMRALMAARGRVLSRTQLIDAAMGSEVVVTDRTIDVHITALRRKVSANKDGESLTAWIGTIRGVGYTFRQPVAAVV